MAEKTTDRIFVIGGSHVKRMVGGLESLNMDIVDLSRPGWRADPEHIADIAEKLKKYDIADTDTLLIDPLSNTAVCGTDTNRMLINQIKIGDGWHIVGAMSYVPKQRAKTLLAKIRDIALPGKNPRIIALSPLPRYVIEKCCLDPEHITNADDNDFLADIDSNIEILEELLNGWAQSINVRSEVFSFRMVADNPGDDLHALQVRSDPLWRAGDPVHGSVSYYAEMASAVVESVRAAIMEDGSEPPAKRARLESTIVRRPSVDRPSKSHHSASWSTGTLPPTRGRGGNTRGGPARGSRARGRGLWWRRPHRGWGKKGH
jgi:hypothetical protein